MVIFSQVQAAWNKSVSEAIDKYASNIAQVTANHEFAIYSLGWNEKRNVRIDIPTIRHPRQRCALQEHQWCDFWQQLRTAYWLSRKRSNFKSRKTTRTHVMVYGTGSTARTRNSIETYDNAPRHCTVHRLLREKKGGGSIAEKVVIFCRSTACTSVV